MAEKQKVHGRATVGVGVSTAQSVERLVARAERIRDALKRAEGTRRTDLQAELKAITERLAAARNEVLALHRSLGRALAELGAEEAEDPAEDA